LLVILYLPKKGVLQDRYIMTIAACYPCLEGVVFGSDSTTTFGTDHHYNFCQKLFEFGERESSVAIVMWGLGTLPKVSYRTLIAETADAAQALSLPSLENVARLWAETFWSEYNQAFEQQLFRARAIAQRGATVTVDERREFTELERSLSCGFCIGGRWGLNRRPYAYEIFFNPFLVATPTPQLLSIGTPRFWGVPNLIHRVNFGIDPQLL
jgi:predicted proteasome-type protease